MSKVPFKVVIVHNAYQQRGGEDVVFEGETALLKEMGVEVTTYRKNNQDISYIDRFNVALSSVYSKKTRHEFRDVLRNIQPDIVHVHNFFPLITPAIYDACQDMGVPVVQTLHNYRIICSDARLIRKGNICKKCLSGSPYHALLYKCYRNSLLGSFSVATMVAVHRHRGTWNRKINRFIALTKFAKDIFTEGGLPVEKIVVKPNFLVKKLEMTDEEEILSDKSERRGALFVGRLCKEKGVSTLLNAWESVNIPLRIVGEGPLESMVVNHSSPHIHYLGRLKHDDVLAEMDRSAFLIMPSECYETFGLVIIEAFSQGLPVLASNMGAMAEIVDDGVTGLHFQAGNACDLAEKANLISNNQQKRHKMGLNARKVYEYRYTPERNYKILMDIYQQAIEDAHSSQ